MLRVIWGSRRQRTNVWTAGKCCRSLELGLLPSRPLAKEV